MYINRKGAVLCTAFFLSSLLIGCQNSPKDNLQQLAINSPLDQPIIIKTNQFSLIGWGKNKYTSHVNIYIEGDGQAWEDRGTISPDPSPYKPVGFLLALADNRPDSVLYLARPCQFTMDHKCTPLDWTSDRFSSKAVSTFHQALEQVKKTWAAKTFSLHAYSGGATIALLIAAHRKDINEVITFAPLLDHEQWTKFHHYSPLCGSLSPVKFASSLRKVTQHHFIGQDDTQVPYITSSRYFTLVPPSSRNRVQEVPNFGHQSDWPEFWKSYILYSK